MRNEGCASLYNLQQSGKIRLDRTYEVTPAGTVVLGVNELDSESDTVKFPAIEAEEVVFDDINIVSLRAQSIQY